MRDVRGIIENRFAGLEIAERSETAEACALINFTQSFGKLFPDSGAEWIEVGGGIAAFSGPDSSLNEAKGIGIGRKISKKEFALLESFFFDHGLPVRIAVCPFTDKSLIELINNSGYRIMEMESVLYRPLKRGEYYAEPPEHVDIHVAEEAEKQDWSRILTRGFFGVEEPTEEVMAFAYASFSAKDLNPYLVRCDGMAAGAGTLNTIRKTALLAGTTTLPDFRNRGLHQMLIARRLVEAAAAGCDLALYGAQPASNSHRNAERQGFLVAYNKVNLTKDKG